MEIRAYDEIYLDSAQNIIGHMFDYAINENKILPDDFAGIFSVSPIAHEIEKGNPTYVAGKTGPEIARLVLSDAGYKRELQSDVMYEDKSPEYWAGWSLAYYQWYKDYSFRYIFNAVPFSDILNLYSIYHEMDIIKFVEEITRRIELFYPKTALEYFRSIRGLTKEDLAFRTGITPDEINRFENNKDDIKNASSIIILKLSKVLGCSMEQLIK